MTPLEPEARKMFEASVQRLMGDPPISNSSVEGARRNLWSEMAANGVLGLGLPDWAGGADASLSDVGIVMRAIGRSLRTEPYLSSAVLSAPLLARSGAAEAKAMVEAVARGKAMLSLAHFEPLLGFARGPIAARAACAGEGWILTGEKFFVLDADLADAFLITAVNRDGALGLYLVASDALNLDKDTTATVSGRRIGTLRFAGVRAVSVGTGDVAALLDWALDRAAVACCAEALGAMETVVVQTRNYLKTRRAFGKYLSQFQVLQHRIVDMMIALEETAAIVEVAEVSCEGDPQLRAQMVAACKVTTSRAARFVGSQGIQLHGGIGMTDDLVIGTYYKSLMMLEACFGNGEHHLDAYTDRARAALETGS